MVHPRFLDVIREIYMRDMSVYVLNTNGWFITQELLDELRTTGFDAEVQLSFDGTGTHDWMRQCEGAEERAIYAMELLRKNGFTVSVNMQVNRKNVHTMMDSVRLLDSLGVVSTRIVRTTETPRWVQNAQGACLSVEEYYASMLDFAGEYVRGGLSMDVGIWQYVYLLPRQQCISLIPVKCPRGHSSDAKPCCSCTFDQVAVTSSGEIVPCNQASGTFLKRGMSLGNVRETPLRDLLSGGDYLKIAKMTVGDLRESGEKCATCGHLGYCGGGCRCLGCLYAGDTAFTGFFKEDPTKCAFFEGGWYQKTVQALSGWRNLSEIDLEGVGV